MKKKWCPTKTISLAPPPPQKKKPTKNKCPPLIYTSRLCMCFDNKIPHLARKIENYIVIFTFHDGVV